MTTMQPAETGRCAHCKQTRPLFRYEPDHNIHLGPGAFTCRWCTREEQPLLCTRCWSVEAEREENDPQFDEEAALLERICASNARALARREAS